MIGPMAHPRRRPSRLPVGSLGTLVLVAAIEATIAGHRADFAPPWAEDWRFSAWAAERKAPECSVLCFGDSLIKFGVLPRVIEAKIGLKTFNLATSGGTIPSAYFLWKRALDAGAKPKAVVVDFAALMLKDSDALTLQNYPELASLADCADLARTAGDARFLAAAALAKVIPSFHWRFEVQTLIRSSFEGRSGSHRDAGATFRWKWEAERGAQPMPPGRVRHPSEDYLIDGVSPESWTIEPRNEAFLDRFIGLAEVRGIPVYWLLPPLCPEAHARRQARGADEAYGRLARSKQAKFANLIVLDARSSGYDDSVHVDHIHLDQVGASVLSGDVATVLMDRLRNGQTPSRWVTLPSYSGRLESGLPEALAKRGGSTVR